MSSEQMERELLELAAKAAGLTLKWIGDQPSVPYTPDESQRRGGLDGYMWNPLTDDGDTLRLAAALGINIDFADCCAWKRLPNHALIQEFWGGDHSESHKHAITRAAAQLAKGAEKV